MDELRSRQNARVVVHDAPPIGVQDFVNFIADFITPPDTGEIETVRPFGPRNQAEYEKLQRRTRVHRAATSRVQHSPYPNNDDASADGE